MYRKSKDISLYKYMTSTNYYTNIYTNLYFQEGLKISCRNISKIDIRTITEQIQILFTIPTMC